MTTVFNVLTIDGSGDDVTTFSTYQDALRYAKGLMKDINGNPSHWQKISDNHWTGKSDEDIYILETEVDRMKNFCHPVPVEGGKEQ